MVKIHWSFYLIIGIGVLIASYKIDPQKFKLFIWMGYLFLVVGIAKLGIWFISRKKESSVEKKNVGRGIYEGMAQQGKMRFCPRCRSGLQGYENFCPRCAQRLR